MDCADHSVTRAAAAAGAASKVSAAIAAAASNAIRPFDNANSPDKGYVRSPIGPAASTWTRRRRNAYARPMTEGGPHHDRDEARRREARAALDRLREPDTLAGSGLARAARRAGDHFAATDAAGPDGAADPIELWGRRIGRALSLLAVIGLSIYLYLTYLR